MTTRPIVTAAGRLALLALLATGCSDTRAAGEWPGRQTINIAVFASPGGSTDLANRALAAALERELGARFSVLNMPGAHGGLAAAYVWNAPRDGQTWFGTAEASLALAVMGAHSTTTRDWRYFIVGGSPGVLSVPAGAPHRDIDDLLTAIRSRPGQIRLASSFPASAWHVQYLALARAGDLEVRWVSYPGSHPSQVAALSGEVDVVLTALGEQVEFLRAGRLRPLATIQTEAVEVPGVGWVPPITEALPAVAEYLPLRQFVGFALPADTPPEILERVEAAFHRAMQSEEVLNFARQSHSDLLGLSGEEAREFVERQQRVYAWFLHDEGVAMHSPAEFGIERP
jgi:tripartite-type tricarboxylate transporter receptor subunit TctC